MARPPALLDVKERGAGDVGVTRSSVVGLHWLEELKQLASAR